MRLCYRNRPVVCKKKLSKKNCVGRGMLCRQQFDAHLGRRLPKVLIQRCQWQATANRHLKIHRVITCELVGARQ